MANGQTRETGTSLRIHFCAALCAALVGAVLAGCTTSNVLDPNGTPTASADGVAAQPLFSDGQTNVSALTEPAGPGADTAAPLAAQGGNRVLFAPVIGASPSAVPALSNRLSARARQRGITIVDAGGSAPVVMKGYFSAFADGSKTSVIYVWDVLDSSGNRLHRIQGQQAAPGGSGDGWSSVNNATMEAVADDTIQQLAAWMAQRQS